MRTLSEATQGDYNSYSDGVHIYPGVNGSGSIAMTSPHASFVPGVSKLVCVWRFAIIIVFVCVRGHRAYDNFEI